MQTACVSKRAGVTLLGCGLAVAMVAGGLSSQAMAQPRTVTVYVFNFDYSIFRPSENPEATDPIINVGDTIRWQWIGGTHDVIGIQGQAEVFASPLRGSGFTYSHTFTIPGEYQYYCSLHGGEIPGLAYGMAGTVTVLPTPAAGGLLAVAGLVAVRRRR
jgi:MYXO-CTERM domain-containing protein